MSESGVIPRPWQGSYVTAAEGKRIAIGVQDGEILIGPSLYTEPIWRLDQERAEEFAQALIRAAWRAEATLPP